MNYPLSLFDSTQKSARSLLRTRGLAVCVLFCVLTAANVRDAVAQDPDTANRPVDHPVDRQEVLDAIENLRSRSFRVRQDTEEQLWRMGPAIEPILIYALDTDDLEVRDRIASLRFKFELGLTPDMPASKRNWIMTAIGGSGDKERREATAKLAGAGEFAAVTVVLERIKSAKELSDYYAIIMTATRAREPSDELDDFHFGLLRRAMAEPNSQDSIRMTRAVLRDTAVRKRATTTPWIQRLVSLIVESQNDATRRNLIDGIYFDSATIGKIAQSDLLHQWINAVAKEPDRTVRLRHVAKVLSSSTLMNAFGSGYSGISIDIGKLYKNLTPAGRNALVDSASHVPQALSALHHQLGDEPLLESIGGSADVATRGNLLGRIAALESWPKEKDQSRGVMDLIDRESGVAKHQVVIGYLEGLGKREKEGGAAPEAVAESLWLMLNTENEEAWQLVALLETYMSPRTFGDRHSNESIDRMIRLTPHADSKGAQLYAYGPLSRSHLGKELAKHKRSLDFLRSLGNLPASTSINSRYRSLLNSTSFTNTLSSKEDRLKLLAICRDEIEIAPRYYAASGILSNKTLLKQLLSEGHFSLINECLIDSQDRSRLATIISTFMINQATIDHLVKQQRIHDVLDFQKDRKFSESEQFSILFRYVSSDALVTSLLEAGHYESLIEMIDNVKGESQRKQLQGQLTHRKAFARLLARQGKLKTRLQELFADKNWVTRRGYNNLISNLDLDDIKAEPGTAGVFWEFAAGLQREYDRRECIRTLLASKWFLIQLQEQGQLGVVARAIPKLIEPKYFYSMLQSTFRGSQVVYFLDKGQLNALIELSVSLSLENQRRLFQYMGYSSHVQKWFAGKDQPDRLFSAIDSIENMTMRARFAASIFSSGILGRYKGKDLTPS